MISKFKLSCIHVCSLLSPVDEMCTFTCPKHVVSRDKLNVFFGLCT